MAIMVSIVPLYIAGARQSYQWHALDANGQLQFPSFLQTLQDVLPMYWGRAIGGGLFLVGLFLAFISLIVACCRGSNAPEREYILDLSSAGPVADPISQPSQLTGVLEFGKKLDEWSHFIWHRRWERLPSRFLLGSLVALVAAVCIQFVPMVLLPSNAPKIAKIQDYTPLELAGRSIYLKEGCQSCHSQSVRPLLADTKRYGNYSQAGEFAYDKPAQWGSRRIGPDLAREGGKQSNYWHYQHLIQPQQLSSGSNMPSYRHLLNGQLDIERLALESGMDVDSEDTEATKQIASLRQKIEAQAQSVTAALVQQGGPVSLDQGRRLVQSTKMIALIAYLQRLGTDIAKSDVAPATK
jgi:cytochrome c oxidase cbb3-type subunit I/II